MLRKVHRRAFLREIGLSMRNKMQSIDERLRTYMPFFGTWELKDPPELLGRGSSGTVYRIWNQSAGGMLDAALKVIPIPKDEAQAQKWLQEAGGSEAGLRRRIKEEFDYVQAEIETLETLKADSHIVCFENYKIYKRNDTPLGWDVLIRMERLVTLNYFLEHIENYPHKRDLRLVLTIWDELLSGLSLCERNHVLHLDIKPENIFYAEPGKDYFKLGDFGVSIRNEKDKIAGKGTRVGTIDYMSPEMYNFEGSDSRSDMYSLAIVIYELLNGGRLPFMTPSDDPNDSIRRRDVSLYRLSGKEGIPPIKGVDNRLMQIILKCVAFTPNDRYLNIQQVQSVLRAYMYSAPSENVKGSGGKSKKALFIGIGAASVIGLMIFALPRLFPDDSTRGNEPTQSPLIAEPVELPQDTEPVGTTEEPVPTPTVINTPTPTPTATPEDTPSPVPADEETPVPALELSVGSELTEDETTLVVRTNQKVDVSLYYFKKDEPVEISPAFKALEFQVDGEYSLDMISNGLEEGDTCVLTYENEDGELQQLAVAVGPSQRRQLELDINDLRVVKGQSYPVLRGGILNATVNGQEDDFVTWSWRRMDSEEESDGDSAQVDAQGRVTFDLTSNDCDIGDEGTVITVTVSYSDGRGVSKWCSKDVLWTTDETAEIEPWPVMEGDTSITFETEPGSAVAVYRNGEQLGESVRADENGEGVWTGDAALMEGDAISIHVVDRFGNEDSTDVSVTKYQTQIENLQGSRVMGDIAYISGVARPGTTLQAKYVDGSNQETVIAKDIQANETDGVYSAEIDAKVLNNPDNELNNSRIEVGNDSDGYISTETFDWMLRVQLQLAEALTEDSEALVVDTEPGATVAVSLAGNEVFREEADSEGFCAYKPDDGFERGANYTITAIDPDPSLDSRTSILEVEVLEADRALITAEIANTVGAGQQTMPFVKGGNMIVVGEAEPNAELTVRWNSSTPIDQNIETSADGHFEVSLPADANITDLGTSATVSVFYADGKAAGKAFETEELMWTTDDDVKLVVDSLMEYSKRIGVYTDVNAKVSIIKDGKEIAAGSADGNGLFNWEIEASLTPGDVYHFESEDSFGNQRAVEMRVLRFSAQVEGIEDNVLKANSAALSGIAQPNSLLTVSLRVNDETYLLQEDLSTDVNGEYSALYSADELAQYGVDGSEVQFIIDCGGEQVETVIFAWNITVPMNVTPKVLTEDSESLEIVSEPGDLLTIAIIGDNGEEETVYSDILGEDGRYRYIPEDFFVGGSNYRVTSEDPHDTVRPSNSQTLLVEEASRMDITIDVLGLEIVDGWDDLVNKGEQMTIKGNAEPNQGLTVCWARESNQRKSNVILKILADDVTVAADGSYQAALQAGNVIGLDGEKGFIYAYYSDRKAQSKAQKSDDIIWTTDDKVIIEAKALMEGDTTLLMTTDANAQVSIYNKGVLVNSENEHADALGNYSINFDEGAKAGNTYVVEVRDNFGNTASLDAEVAADPYKAITMEINPGDFINAHTEELSIAGTAEPNTELRLHLNEKEYSVVVSSKGEFIWSESVANLSSLLADNINIQAVYADGHTNRASMKSAITVDREIPKLTVDLSGLSVRTTEISGNTELGATVALRINGVEMTTLCDEGGFSFENIELHDNDVIELQAWDEAGNVSDLMQTIVGKQEAARVFADIQGNSLYVTGWVVCDELGDLKLEVGGLSIMVNKYSVVEPADLAEELAGFEGETGVHVNTDGKNCIRIDEQVIDVSKLSAGSQELQMIMDDFPESRLLDSVVFEKETNAVVVPNVPALDEENSAYAIGLDDAQPMNSGGILLTGWYYGSTEFDTYTISEVRLVETYAEANTNANDEIIQAEALTNQLSFEGELQEGYIKLKRQNTAAACPMQYREALGEIAATDNNAGFMVWINNWEGLADGDYKVVVVVLCGGKMYYPSAQLSIRNGEAAITSRQMQNVAEIWDPQPIEEASSETGNNSEVLP